MKAQRRGAIVNIASLGGVRGRPFRHTYIASKHAIVGLTKSIALEGIAHNIRSNAIAPGPVDTRGEKKTSTSTGPQAGLKSASWYGLRRLPGRRCFSLPMNQSTSPASCCRSTQGSWPVPSNAAR